MVAVRVCRRDAGPFDLTVWYFLHSQRCTVIKKLIIAETWADGTFTGFYKPKK